METLCKRQQKVPLLGISVLIMVALLVSACGHQSLETKSLPTVATTPTAGSLSPELHAPTASVTHGESPKTLTAVRMVSQSVGWAIAEKTTVLRTTDGGNHWTDVTPHYSDPPLEIVPSFADGLHAWIGYVGTWDESPITILRTDDGGKSWQWATISDYGSTIVSLQFSGSNYRQGWLMVGRETGASNEAFGLYATTDGGQNWLVLPTLYTSDQMGGLSFLDTTTGFLASGGYPTPQLSVTHDGGRSWKNLSLPVVPGLPGKSITYMTTPPVFFGSLGFLPVYLSMKMSAGKMVQGFVIYTTSDGGTSWVAKNYRTLLAIGGPSATSDLCLVDQTHFYVTNQKGATLLSTNGGTSWITLAGTVGSGVTSLSFTDSQHGWAVGGDLWRTTDGGNSWQAVDYRIQGS